MRRRQGIAAGGFRRRLTITFALAVGLSAAALGTGTYFVVRHNLLADSVDSSVTQTRRNLDVARAFRAADANDLIDAYRSRGDFKTVATRGGRVYLSGPQVTLQSVPDGLREVVARGELGYQRAEVGGARYVVTGASAANGTHLYFFFPEDGLWHELAQLRNILLGGVGILVLLAAGAGILLARGTLRPVARASEAAHSLAEGLLETRLPVEGQDEFGAWAQAFNEMAAALEAKIAALSAAQARERRFTSDVAHELRTPLTALVGEASLLAEHLDRMPPESRRPAELLIADVGRLRRLVEELMEISRFDQGAESVQAEKVDPAALVAATVRNRGWDGRVAVEGNGRSLTTDPRRLERIVANLVDNAFEHGGSAVTVRITGDGIEVADDGPGIAPEHLPHLFERFYKADASRSGSGTGLGLAIAQENARLLGGEIQVQSELGAGSSFTLRLPVAEPRESAPKGALGREGGRYQVR
ncbi:MAG TPA: HAMP domain-containing sensor histidine kinase [Gaiellaceae bacterium]|jgi:signal transduction histidine kinase|nr:HAMP domain-containing sensor histidine kinase [Candidatus Binatia bacterium]HUI37167.1 HAMP domain-containing sensor histidine kinase [Gaiellaceae bacterium]